MSRISEEEQDKRLELLEQEYLYGQSDLNVVLPNQVKQEEIYNANLEFNDYTNKLKENYELFTQEEYDKLKTEEAYIVYTSLTIEQKQQMFPLSYSDDLSDDLNGFNNDDDMFINDEEDTLILE